MDHLFEYHFIQEVIQKMGIRPESLPIFSGRGGGITSNQKMQSLPCSMSMNQLYKLVNYKDSFLKFFFLFPRKKKWWIDSLIERPKGLSSTTVVGLCP